MKTYYDYIIIGSGFGGSVSALRLAQKGYSVAVFEQGRRFYPEDFPKSNWNLPKFLWLPKLRFHGIMAMTLLKDVFVLHGAGVGGGSLVYANNLLIPPDSVFKDDAWGITDARQQLLPYYRIARKMLGAVPSRVTTKADEILKSCAADIHREDTFHVNDVGIYFGEPDVEVKDPFFSDKGPDRTGCTLCGSCMTGCRVGAKNTLDMNYLYLAEGLGVEIIPETTVVNVTPGEFDGYEVQTVKTGSIIKKRSTIKAGGVIFSGGVMGSVKLLLKLKENGSLPELSDQLGNFVRTNSEALVGIVADDKGEDYSAGIAITSGIYPDENTHIETVRYGKGHDAMALFATLLVGGGGRLPRPVRFLATVIRHPLKFLKSLYPFGWARRTTILLVMQTISNYMRFTYKRRWWRLGGFSMNSHWKTEHKVPSFLPVANEFAQRFADKIGGEPISVLPEVLFDTSSTAHILGGCIMSDSKDNGVIDFTGEIHGYKNLYVIDGSIIPTNLGVNPSLTITALAEYLMDKVPEKGGRTVKSNACPS